MLPHDDVGTKKCFDEYDITLKGKMTERNVSIGIVVVVVVGCDSKEIERRKMPGIS